MHLYFTSLTFILGLVLASFLNALLYRIDNGFKYPDIFIKGSHCERCGKLLKTYELIPVLSYFIFKGKCSICNYKIPLYYPLSEFFLSLGLASIYYYSLSPTLYIVLIFFFCFSYYDRIYKGVPRSLVNIFLILTVVYFFALLLTTSSIPDNSIVVGLLFSLLIFFLGKILKKPFGLGDILMLLALSVIFDIYAYVGFIYIFLFLSTGYALYLVLRKKATFKSSLALLPFMFMALSFLFLFNDLVNSILKKVLFFGL